MCTFSNECCKAAAFPALPLGGMYTAHMMTHRAVASGVKGSDDYRGPRLREGPPAISTDWLRPAKKDAQDSLWATAVRCQESV